MLEEILPIMPGMAKMNMAISLQTDFIFIMLQLIYTVKQLSIVKQVLINILKGAGEKCIYSGDFPYSVIINFNNILI